MHTIKHRPDNNSQETNTSTLFQEIIPPQNKSTKQINDI